MAALSAPHFEFIELETAKAFGYTLTEWRSEHPDRRARLIAHEMERGMREAYRNALHVARMDPKRKRTESNAFERQKSRWGLA
jgi:hypothetical protein